MNDLNLPTALHRKINLNCTKFAFKLGINEVELLGANKQDLLQIGKNYFQLVGDEMNQVYFLFKVSKQKLEKVYQITPDGELTVKGKSKKILDLTDFKDESEEPVQIVAEKIDVTDIEDTSEIPPLNKEKPKPPKTPKDDNKTKYFEEENESEDIVSSEEQKDTIKEIIKEIEVPLEEALDEENENSIEDISGEDSSSVNFDNETIFEEPIKNPRSVAPLVEFDLEELIELPEEERKGHSSSSTHEKTTKHRSSKKTTHKASKKSKHTHTSSSSKEKTKSTETMKKTTTKKSQPTNIVNEEPYLDEENLTTSIINQEETETSDVISKPETHLEAEESTTLFSLEKETKTEEPEKVKSEDIVEEVENISSIFDNSSGVEMEEQNFDIKDEDIAILDVIGSTEPGEVIGGGDSDNPEDKKIDEIVFNTEPEELEKQELEATSTSETTSHSDEENLSKDPNVLDFVGTDTSEGTAGDGDSDNPEDKDKADITSVLSSTESSKELALPKEPVVTETKNESSKWFNESFTKYHENEKEEEQNYQTQLDLLSKTGNYTEPEETRNSKGFWFSLKRDFRDTEEFWKDLTLYYQVSSEDLNKKLVGLDSDTKPPVFSKKERSDINLVDLQHAITEKINERLKFLEESKSNIKQQLLEVGDKLIRAGINVDTNEDHQKLKLDQKAISECIEKTYESLDNYTNLIKQIGEEAASVVQKSVIDIHGCPQIISKHYEKITEKLVDLNLEINFIRKSHLELERELIKRLKDVEEAKDFKNKLLQLERAEILEEYQEENREKFENQDRAEIYKDLGALSESTTFIQQKIEDEKRKINYYMDNLKALSAYENYEANVYELQKKKKEHRRAIKNFRREIYKLQLWLSRKEKKHDDFFINLDKEISSLRSDVASACADNSTLAEQCIRHWKDRWNSEGIPVMEEMFTRTARIIEAFAPIPSTQIVKLSKLKHKLMEEVSNRQKEWQRIFTEIKKEFREMNYELDVPVSSELDSKYLDKLDAAVLSLSKDTQKAIFLPEENFRLANYVDERIGLNPKTVDDSSFLVIDQVWDTLTPEQEVELEKALKADKKNNAKSPIVTAQEQLKNLQNRFPVKKATFEQNLRSLSDTEKHDKYRDIESTELQTWRGDNYLIANSRGEFKDILYEITKKLFSSKSVRVVDQKMVFTNTGNVRDGNTEILSPQDYFIKPDDKEPFTNATDDLDLSELVNVHNEPDSEMIELMSDPTYVSHAREREERLSSVTKPIRPSISEWAQISLKKYQEEKGKIYDVESLRGRVLEMEDELKLLKKYHTSKTKELDEALSNRNESFEELRKEVDKAKEFLSEKDKELTGILKEIDKKIDQEIDEANQAFFKEEPIKEKKQGLIYWITRFISGSKDKDNKDDFTSV